MDAPAKTPVTGTTHTLPFDKLSPLDFERLCLWLVKREGYQRAEHLGAAGSEQGRDVTAWKVGVLWTFQCKRVKRFGATSALQEIDKVLGLAEGERPAGIVFLVTCNVSAKTRKAVRDRCAGAMECEFWTGTELDEKVKQHPDILQEFFDYAAPPTPRARLPKEIRFEPVLVTFISERVVDGDAARVRTRDGETLAALREVMTSYGALSHLREHDFGNTFDPDWFANLRELVQRCKGPDLEFLDQELERLRLNLLTKVDEFLHLLGTETFLLNGPGTRLLNSVPKEWRHKQPERYVSVVQGLNTNADAVMHLYDDLIRQAKQRL